MKIETEQALLGQEPNMPEPGLFGLDLHGSLPVSASAAVACRSPTA